MKRTLLLMLTTAVASQAYAAERDDLDPGAKLPVSESHITLKLKPMPPHRLFVLDSAFPAAEAAKTYIIDADAGKIEGMFNQAYWPNFGISPDNKELYAVDTYFEKHTRGKRSDFIVVRDAETLNILSDIGLPNGRLLIVPKKYNFGVSPDGRYAYTYNLAPVTAVGVTDLKARKFLGDIETPSCGLVFPLSSNRFSTLCADGSVATYSFDAALKPSVQRAEKVFDGQNDPAFEHSGWDRKNQRLHLITYSGKVKSLDLSPAAPKVLSEWSLQTDAEREAGWLPGGWQFSHVHSDTQKMYVLMHQGKQWTHKNSGSQVWVFDLKSSKKIQTIELQEPAQSIAVSQDANPLLYVIEESTKVLALDPKTGKEKSTVGTLGFSPQLLSVPGE
ncbi:amine dehydrogenase large subunit [Pseudomonas aeruginosa]|uniref:amine dehydrogenase large subunit n=1 Tax=Pseudomonas aeruginosa TaxID=287 RepID=UPI000EB474E1|nr:amine dehydrogenase large subunit [Pseudomonas aeruginosa]NNB83811.1 hypothetical protein [Pseudomonas aeruginosa]